MSDDGGASQASYFAGSIGRSIIDDDDAGEALLLAISDDLPDDSRLIKSSDVDVYRWMIHRG